MVRQATSTTTVGQRPGRGRRWGAAPGRGLSDRGTDRCIRGRSSCGRWRATGLEHELHASSSARTWGLLFDSTVPVTAAMLKYENGGEAASWVFWNAR
jgi:hypothetical protein